MKFSLNLRLIFVILSFVSIILGGTMLIGLFCALAYHEADMARIFLPLALCFGFGGFLLLRFSRGRLKSKTIRIREGILAVALCWVFAAALGALPYLLAGSHHTFIDAFFESTACVTTTGSTLVDDLASLPKSLLFWRQFTNWIGGLGIIIFAITIIPMLGYGAANLANAEMMGRATDKIRARVKDSVRNIFLLFLTITVAEILLLAAGGTGVFDAFVLSFSSVANGGFANYHVGATTGGSLYVDVVVSVFCVIAAMSFVSYQLLLKRRIRDFFRETEIRLFIIILAVMCLFVYIILLASDVYDTAGEAARYGILQTISFMATAGYSGANVDIWPQSTHWLLIAAMIVGGCSGSTSSGVKVVRVAVMLSLIKRNFHKRLHPNAVVAVKLGDKAVPADRVSSIATFVTLFTMTVLLSCFVLSFENLDAETTLGTVMAMISNTGLVLGPGIEFNGALTVFSQFSRVYMSLLMIAGRLELFTIVLLFTPIFWRPYR